MDSTNLLVPGQENQSLKLTWRDETLYWMPHNAYISTFGLVQNGCKIMLQNMTTRVDNHSLVVTFPSLSSVTTLATGYFFDISNCSEESCPSKWLLEINAQQLMKWQRIGASTWRFDSASASTLFFPDIPFIQKLTSGSEVIIDYQKDWKWYIQFLGVNSVCALGWIAISLSALSKRERSAVWYWVIYLKILAIVSLSLAISNLTEGDWRNGVVDFCWIFPVFTLSVGVAFFQKLLIYHLLMYGALLILCKTIEGTLFPISDSNLLLNVLESTGFAVVVLCLVLLAFRWRVLRKSRLLVEEDSRFYDSLWSDLLLYPETTEHLQRLKSVINRIQGDRNNVTQLLHQSIVVEQSAAKLNKLSILSNHSLFDGMDAYDTSVRIRIESLDQLYFQAHCLHPILLAKVKKWARLSSGLFPVMSDAAGASQFNYINYSMIEGDPSLSNSVCWAKVKSVERAIEKAVRTYKHVSHKILKS